jgi:tripartite-type tricarboxylate transporter receptor subunit TctC
MNPSNPDRRTAIKALGACAVSTMAPFAHAQAWPAKPVRIVHGYDSGSNPDTVGRAISQALGERLGQPIVIEPKPGAGGRIATGYVATQEPDGYTLMMLTGGDGVNAATEPKLPYDLLRDYSFVGMVSLFAFMLLVKADSPYKTLSDVIEAAKKNPGKLTFATPGVRTTQHLSGELVKATAGVDLLHVPFKGNAFTELIGGRLDMMIAAPTISTPQIRGGAVRAIAVTGKTRMATFPDVPTVAETLPGFEVTSWLGLAAPAKTPAAAISRINADLRQVLAQEAVRARLLAIGTEPAGGPAEDMRSRVEADIRKWKQLAQTAKLDG